jgi:hypothetical protein
LPRQIDIDKVSDEEIQDIVITANLTQFSKSLAKTCESGSHKALLHLALESRTAQRRASIEDFYTEESSQVSQTAARGRNRLAEFTGESLPTLLPTPSGHTTGFILRPFATRAEPIVEEGCPTAKVEARTAPSIGGCAWATLQAGRTRTRASQPAQPRDDYCGSGKASLVVMAKSTLRRQFRDGFETTINRSGSPPSAA